MRRAEKTHARMKRTRVAALMVALGAIPIALAGVLVAPAYATSSGETSASSISAKADTPDVSWDDVAAAQANAAAAKALVDKIKSEVAALQQNVTSTQAAADAAGTAYGKAQDAFDSQQYKVDTLQTQVDAAQTKADTAKKTSNQLLAAIGKTGGGFDVTTTLMTSSNPGAMLSQLSTYGQVTGRSKQIIAQALAAQNAVNSLKDQADAAKVILAKYKDAAEAAFAQAQTAAQAATDALASAQTQVADLTAKAAALEGQADAALTAYNDSLVAKWGPGAAGVVSSSGWANPANGYLGDRFGLRFHPIYHIWKLHSGQDISGTGCGAPIYAAHSGTVIYAGPNGDLGNFIELDNGGGVVTGYGHIIAGGILVSIGQHVGPGQQIAKVGSTGGVDGLPPSLHGSDQRSTH